MTSRLVAFACLLALATSLPVLAAPSLAQTSTLRVTLASTPEAISGRPEGQPAGGEPGGFRVSLLREAGRSCGAEIAFATAPWPRALEMVKTGSASGAFAASFSAERASFAAFPMRGGEPDPTRAMREQIYHLFASADAGTGARERSAVTIRDGQVSPPGLRAVVERGSIGVAIARAASAEPVEVGGYPSMVRMVAERREPAMIGVDQHVQAVLRREPALGTRLARVEPPLMRQHSYVMFGLAFHDRNRDFAECFWAAIATIRASDRYREMVRAQNDGAFIE